MAKQAGDKVGQVVTEFASGVGHGIDKSMDVAVELSPKLTAEGISNTVAKSIGMNPNEKGISVYLIAAKELNAKLLAKAMDKQGQEIGRSIVDAYFQTDDAQYIKFIFNKEMDTQLVDKYTIDIKEILLKPPATTQEPQDQSQDQTEDNQASSSTKTPADPAQTPSP